MGPPSLPHPTRALDAKIRNEMAVGQITPGALRRSAVVQLAQLCATGGVPPCVNLIFDAPLVPGGSDPHSPLRGRGGEGEALAAWLADAVLAERLNWPFALPMLAAALDSAAEGHKGGDAGDRAEEAIVFAYAQAAAQACDRTAELGRRAQRLLQATPKLRAKGAGAALQALLDDDSLSAATPISGLSERGARRLFDRLVALGAVRELTGRATFRLYGL